MIKFSILFAILLLSSFYGFSQHAGSGKVNANISVDSTAAMLDSFDLRVIVEGEKIWVKDGKKKRRKINLARLDQFIKNHKPPLTDKRISLEVSTKTPHEKVKMVTDIFGRNGIFRFTLITPIQ